MHYCKANQRYVIPMAPTGIAASLLENGQTIHSRFGIPIPIEETSVSRVRPASTVGRLINQARLIITDEASQIDRHVLECVDRFMRDLKVNQCPFGGVCFLLAGDFRQCLPVVELTAFETQTNTCITNSPLWANFEVIRLNQNMRALPEQIRFKDYLLQIGDGTLPAIDTHNQLVRVPEELLENNSIVDAIYGPDLLTFDQLNLTNRAILSPKNSDTIELNQQILERLEGKSLIEQKYLIFKLTLLNTLKEKRLHT